MNYSDNVRAEIVARLNKLGFAVQSELRKNLNRDQPYKRVGPNYRGFAPSKPGEYPRKLSGSLMKSIAFRVDDRALSVTVGTAQRHGRFLQSGTNRMAPRPFLTLVGGFVRGMVDKLFGGR